MTFKVKKSGAFSDPTAVKRKSGGSFIDVGFVKVMKGGVWVTVWPTTPVVSITDQEIIRTSTLNTTAGYALNASGAVEKTEGTSTTTLETWLLSGSAGDYQVRATLLSGDTPSGTFGTWQTLSSTRTWSLQDVVADATVLSAIFTVEIRLTSSGVVLDTATIELTSEKL